MAKKVKKSDFIASGQVAVNRRATFDYAIEITEVLSDLMPLRKRLPPVWNCAVPKSNRCGWARQA